MNLIGRLTQFMTGVLLAMGKEQSKSSPCCGQMTWSHKVLALEKWQLLVGTQQEH